MLWNASGIIGYSIAASDGELGKVSDLLFDDVNWQIRWVVVDTRHWLSGRTVLLPTSVLGHPHLPDRQFPVRLTMKQVEDSPDIDTHQPVARQLEANIFDYYGWAPYWGSGYLLGGYGGYYAGGAMASSPALEPGDEEANRLDHHPRRFHDPHLRSVKAVSGYHIHASDGAIGHVEDFMVEEADWSIHFLVVDTRNWWPGRKVLISPRSARNIDWVTMQVELGIDRQRVKDGPAYDPTMTVDRAYERHFHSYYGDDLGTD
jgi:sporulation protein YlmC with PRC-barrel domain